MNNDMPEGLRIKGRKNISFDELDAGYLIRDGHEVLCGGEWQHWSKVRPEDYCQTCAVAIERAYAAADLPPGWRISKTELGLWCVLAPGNAIPVTTKPTAREAYLAAWAAAGEQRLIEKGWRRADADEVAEAAELNHEMKRLFDAAMHRAEAAEAKAADLEQQLGEANLKYELASKERQQYYDQLATEHTARERAEAALEWIRDYYCEETYATQNNRIKARAQAALKGTPESEARQ